MLASSSEQTALEGTPPEASGAGTTGLNATPTLEVLAEASTTRTHVEIPYGVAQEITPNDRFYVVSKNFNDPRVPADTWNLEISRLVDQLQRMSYEQILSLATESQHTTLECIRNTLGGNLMSNAYWTGLSVSRLLANVGVQREAHPAVVRSADNYYESFPLERVLAPGGLLAHTMNGAPLPDKHGFQLRLILPGPYGIKNPKWIIKIELVSDRFDGYWVRRGWHREAPVQTVARIDTPTDNATVSGRRLGRFAVWRSPAAEALVVCWRVSTAAPTWRHARTRPPLGPSTWVQWGLDWHDAPPRQHTVLARASDGSGAFQPHDEQTRFPVEQLATTALLSTCKRSFDGRT